MSSDILIRARDARNKLKNWNGRLELCLTELNDLKNKDIADQSGADQPQEARASIESDNYSYYSEEETPLVPLVPVHDGMQPISSPVPPVDCPMSHLFTSSSLRRDLATAVEAAVPPAPAPAPPSLGWRMFGVGLAAEHQYQVDTSLTKPTQEPRLVPTPLEAVGSDPLPLPHQAPSPFLFGIPLPSSVAPLPSPTSPQPFSPPPSAAAPPYSPHLQLPPPRVTSSERSPSEALTSLLSNKKPLLALGSSSPTSIAYVTEASLDVVDKWRDPSPKLVTSVPLDLARGTQGPSLPHTIGPEGAGKDSLGLVHSTLAQVPSPYEHNAIVEFKSSPSAMNESFDSFHERSIENLYPLSPVSKEHYMMSNPLYTSSNRTSLGGGMLQKIVDRIQHDQSSQVEIETFENPSTAIALTQLAGPEPYIYHQELADSSYDKQSIESFSSSHLTAYEGRTREDGSLALIEDTEGDGTDATRLQHGSTRITPPLLPLPSTSEGDPRPLPLPSPDEPLPSPSRDSRGSRRPRPATVTGGGGGGGVPSAGGALPPVSKQQKVRDRRTTVERATQADEQWASNSMGKRKKERATQADDEEASNSMGKEKKERATQADLSDLMPGPEPSLWEPSDPAPSGRTPSVLSLIASHPPVPSKVTTSSPQTLKSSNPPISSRHVSPYSPGSTANDFFKSSVPMSSVSSSVDAPKKLASDFFRGVSPATIPLVMAQRVKGSEGQATIPPVITFSRESPHSFAAPILLSPVIPQGQGPQGQGQGLLGPSVHPSPASRAQSPLVDKPMGASDQSTFRPPTVDMGSPDCGGLVSSPSFSTMYDNDSQEEMDPPPVWSPPPDDPKGFSGAEPSSFTAALEEAEGGEDSLSLSWTRLVKGQGDGSNLDMPDMFKALLEHLAPLSSPAVPPTVPAVPPILSTMAREKTREELLASRSPALVSLGDALESVLTPRVLSMRRPRLQGSDLTREVFKSWRAMGRKLQPDLRPDLRPARLPQWVPLSHSTTPPPPPPPPSPAPSPPHSLLSSLFKSGLLSSTTDAHFSSTDLLGTSGSGSGSGSGASRRRSREISGALGGSRGSLGTGASRRRGLMMSSILTGSPVGGGTRGPSPSALPSTLTSTNIKPPTTAKTAPLDYSFYGLPNVTARVQG